MMVDATAKKILVVDDEKDALIPISNILKRANYEVVSTTKGKEAVELATNLRPDVIFLDIVLPDMAGSDVAAVFSEESPTANVLLKFSNYSNSRCL